jgi:Uncharacterized protein conserved in bacteria (DUF2272)
MIHVISRRAVLAPITTYAVGHLCLKRAEQPNPATASASAPLSHQCGFFGLSAMVSEAELREAVRLATKAERENWFSSAGSAVGDTVDQQFGHLVRYWLARMDTIPPSTLTFAQAKANDSTNLVELLKESVSDADVEAVRTKLLEDAPRDGNPADMNALVDSALRGAHWSRQGEAPWSAVFVDSCIRRTAIELGIEAEHGGLHVGRNALLAAHEGHRYYVKEAYERRVGGHPRNGTYHAFRPGERPVEVGDIVVLDRNVPEAGAITEVVDFDDIPTAFLDPYPLHGDIVVEVASSYVETIGGNLCYRKPVGGDLCNLSPSQQPCAVRRRRFPVNRDGTLVVNREQLFVQEDDGGNLPALPVVCSDAGLSMRSTGRVFTLLSPVGSCEMRSTTGVR